MNENDQRIAIAEACGWERWKSSYKVKLTKPRDADQRAYWLKYNSIDPTAAIDDVDEKLPDYLNDLNAMYEAEIVLTRQQRDAYRDNLAKITTVERYPKDLPEATSYCAENEWAYCHASASQRAEAFLRTIGKWDNRT